MDEYDDYICQICAVVKLPKSRYEQPEWRGDITGNQHAGNVCPDCLKLHKQSGKVGEELRKLARYVQEPPMSLYEHARRESGLTGEALRRYINRHYGHG